MRENKFLGESNRIEHTTSWHWAKQLLAESLSITPPAGLSKGQPVVVRFIKEFAHRLYPAIFFKDGGIFCQIYYALTLE